MCEGYLGESILGKARESGLVSVRVVDIREHASGKHKVTDDAPYGGGPGMVMKPEPLTEAIEAARARLPGAEVILTSPRGERLRQDLARRLAERGRFVVVCGRYEGVDERVGRVDLEVSLGDFSSGQLVALASWRRRQTVPGVLGTGSAGSRASPRAGCSVPAVRDPRSTGDEVPGVLLSGDHQRIERWRRRRCASRASGARAADRGRADAETSGS
jgi:tRNA (guanine37-N1)-methyltransferase